MRLLRMSLPFLVFTWLAPGVALSQPGFDLGPPEFIDNAPPPDSSIPSVVNEIDLGEVGDGPGLEPGDAVLITPESEAIVNPPLPPESGGGVKPPTEPHATLITRDGRAIVNSPLPPESGGTPPTPAPRRNPDGSTTYPPGAPVPFSDGISTYNADGSVTFVPYEHARLDPAPPAPEPPAENPADSSDEGSGDAHAPVDTPSDGSAPDAPSSPGSSMTPEQTRNKLWRDEQQMHPAFTSQAVPPPGPSAEDLRSVREGIESDDRRGAVYIPFPSDHRDPSAVARRDVRRVLYGLEREREQNVSNQRDQPNRLDRPRSDRAPQRRTRQVRARELEREGR